MDVDYALGGVDLGTGRSRFVVWAPQARTVEVHLMTPQERFVPMQATTRGYYQVVVEGVGNGSLYRYRLDGQHEYPDPASRYQPQDVHGPSQVVAANFSWQDQHWPGLPWQEYVIYELHVGTFTAAGTFEAIISHLGALKDLGVTAVELMPIAQFPGSRNWGYDGVYPYAAQAAYGGPERLKRLVDACHYHGLAVVLDVVYNHLGPEGNYLGLFGPYFTDRYKTPWGLALNFDGPHSDEVRRFFIDNALYWITDCHIDALRLDAVHAIVDQSAYTFLEELTAVVHEQAERLRRRVYLIAESDLDDNRIVRVPALGGYGLDAQWNDGFHHALHALLTGERDGYYADFGDLSHLAKAWQEGFVYSGQYSAFRQRRHGNSSQALPSHAFVVCSQNHDQVGNRMLGERLPQLTTFAGLKLAAATVLLSPGIPLLFMGEEYGEPAPFPYFISHLDADLVAAVCRGRREEFAAFTWQGEPPDPQDEATFQSAKLQHELRHQGQHQILYTFYRELLRLRRALPALAHLRKETMTTSRLRHTPALCVHRWHKHTAVFMLLHFAQAEATVTLSLPPGQWHKQLDSAVSEWRGPGSAVPTLLIGAAEITLSLPAQAILLFTRQED